MLEVWERSSKMRCGRRCLPFRDGSLPVSISMVITACFCLIQNVLITEGRPRTTTVSSSDHPVEWRQVADWWKPTEDKDKWRAFKPQKEISISEWWKLNLDEDIWNPKSGAVADKSHDESHDQLVDPSHDSLVSTSHDTLSPASLHAGVSGTKVVAGPTTLLGSKDENKLTTYTSRQDLTVPTSALPPTSVPITPRSINQQPGLKKDEMNTYPEDEADSDYSSSEEDDESRESVGQLQNRDSSASHEHVNSPVTEERKNTPSDSDSGKRVLDASSDQSLLSKSESAPHVPADPALSMRASTPIMDLSKDTVPFNFKPQGGITADSSHQLATNNSETNKISPVINVDLSLSKSEEENRKSNQKKLAVSLATEANAGYRKEESLVLSDKNAVVIDEAAKSEASTRPVVDVTTKRPGSTFVDWKDWDSSMFDYYKEEDDEDTNSGKNKERSSKIEDATKNDLVQPKKELIQSETDENNNNAKKDNEELNSKVPVGRTEQHAVSNSESEDIDMSPVEGGDMTMSSANGQDTVNKAHTRQKSKSGLETIDQQSDEAASHVDHSHYNHGIIYDSQFPNHKPSVKKDLTNPSNPKKEEAGEDSASFKAKGTEERDVPVRKSGTVTHFQPGSLNTEGDASTSPNPAPPMELREKEPDNSEVPVTIPASDILGSQADELEPLVDSKGFILSFPLETCRVDYECRAGRTCVEGVCKCYTPAMCAGHHKPICGSDGELYDSHCELHRIACVNRVHIRPDRRGRCFQKDIEKHEKSWLMEQEQLLQQDQARKKAQSNSQTELSPHIGDQDNTHQEKGVSTAASTMVQIVGEKQDLVTSGQCTSQNMARFKNDLLMFYCHKFVEPNCKVEVKTDREYLSMLMFSYYDKDYDYYLTAQELADKERDEHLTNITHSCHLTDFIRVADTLEPDGKLTVSEFTIAFEPPIPSLPSYEPPQVISTVASAGTGLELKCGLDAENILWRRHGAQLTDDKIANQLMIFDDGALFFSTVGLHHIGNYTCFDASDEFHSQVHRLQVNTLPLMKVNPVMQTHVTGTDIELNCQAEGVPEPVVTWKHGSQQLPFSPHVTHYYGGGHVVIHNAQAESDAGKYTCSAHNQAGTTEKSVTVTILPPSSLSATGSSRDAGTFVLFDTHGIFAYDPLNCLLRHRVTGEFGNFNFIPDALDGPLTLCKKNEECQWGHAVMVGSDLIYVSQPDQNRVMVMDAADSLNPLQVIDTDRSPQMLWYVKHLDQVWVLCASQNTKGGNNTIVVIRDASQHIQHRSVHTQPVGNRFDTVQNLFIAPPNDLGHHFDFGYVSHSGHSMLYKINLEDLSYVKSIDLTNYGCVPAQVAFIPIGGKLVIECVSTVKRERLHLTMDYLTDTVISATSVKGVPMVSPDSRHLVAVDFLTGKISVMAVSDEGVLKPAFDVTVSASLIDATFMAARFHHGYDLVLTLASEDSVILVSLETGKIDKLQGLRSGVSSKTTLGEWSSGYRSIVTSDNLNSYLMTSLGSSLTILDVKFQQVECELPGVSSVGSSTVIYIPSASTRS